MKIPSYWAIGNKRGPIRWGRYKGRSEGQNFVFDPNGEIYSWGGPVLFHTKKEARELCQGDEYPMRVNVTESKRAFSKQRRWQKDQIVKGNCSICGKKRNLYRSYCDDCQRDHAAALARRLGHKLWRPGSRGRVPFYAKIGKLEDPT